MEQLRKILPAIVTLVSLDLVVISCVTTMEHVTMELAPVILAGGVSALSAFIFFIFLHLTGDKLEWEGWQVLN